MKKKSSLVSLLIGIVALAIFLIPTKAAHADVTVTNDCTDFSSIQASINANSSGQGNTNYFNIEPGQSDSWSRLSRTGFILAIVHKGMLRTYYTPTSASYSYKDGKLYQKNNSAEITPLKAVVFSEEKATKIVNMVNLSDGTVQVALSKWKTGGYADYFELSRPAVESWSRNNDPRGFLVSLRAKGEMNEYIYYLPSIENIGGNYLTIKNQAILDWDERTPLKLVNVIKY
ncbi:MAG: hypothetical protein E6X39_03680 [Enterococcus hirae]|nr:hypothetical protein [Enterococcus hirae]